MIIKMKGLDLFSGIGGLSIALESYVKTVAYCEIEPYCQAVLLERMQENALDSSPIFTDVRRLSRKSLSKAGIGPVDIIYGGFPCQDISVAGNGKGLAGERSGLFFQVCRLVEEIQPSFVFLENVPAIRTRGLREVIRSLTNLGYDCRWTCVSAAEVGAPHLRKRWFLLAHANGLGRGLQSVSGRKLESKTDVVNDGTEESLAESASKRLQGELWESSIIVESYRKTQSQGSKQTNKFIRCSYAGKPQDVANPHGSRCLRENSSQSEKWLNNSKFTWTSDLGGWPHSEVWWSVEPDVGRVVDGLPFRVDRIKALGNAVVPQQAKEAFERLIGLCPSFLVGVAPNSCRC